ncbi:MAG: hypothetical protein GC154_02040 [bacterium]|nr:hypothetical protein [bacterium]
MNKWLYPRNLIFLLAGVHLCFITFLYYPVVSGPDANGYAIQARLIADEGRTWFTRESSLQFISPHWLETYPDQYFSRYPIGYSLLQAVVYSVAGIHAMLYLNVLLTSANLFLLYLVGRNLIGEWWSLIAALIMAANPVTNGWAFMGDTHPAIAFFLLAGLFFLLRWKRTRTISDIVIAGLILGYIPIMHYAEAVYSIGVILYLFTVVLRDRTRWKSAAIGAAASALPLVGLIAYNKIVAPHKNLCTSFGSGRFPSPWYRARM